MQLTSSSILGMPSNSSVAPANSPAASTTQRGVRASATELGPVPTVLPVRTPVGFRLMPPVLHTAPSGASSSVGVSRASCVPVNGALQALPTSTTGSDVVNGVGVNLDHAQQTNPSRNNRASAFGRVHVSTSVPFLISVLAKQSFLGVDNPNLAQPEPIAVIRESKLRALLMKALEWFINRECASLDGAVIVFVGRRARGNGPATRLALPLAAVHKVADEFGPAGRHREFDLEFEEFGANSFRTDHFHIEHSRWAVPVAGIMGIMGLCGLVFLYAFLRDVATLLIVAPTV